MAICNFSVSCAASLPQNRNPEEPFVIIEADGSPKPENDAASVPASRQDESYSIEIKKETLETAKEQVEILKQITGNHEDENLQKEVCA